MRITNNIMMNNSLTNINSNKTLVDKLNTQLSTQQKIQKPSEDPIVAIRALRLRSTLSEISQYLDKNIPDAEAWLGVTEDALSASTDLIQDIIYYCNQAANDTNESADRNNIVETLKNYRDQIYQNGNADYAGRSIFTGYKTDSTLTFNSNDTNAKYSITQNFKFGDIETSNKLVGGVDIDNVSEISSDNFPQNVAVNRIRLAYDKLDVPADGLTVSFGKDADGNEITKTAITRSLTETNPSAYEPGDDEVIFIPETGELVFGKNVMAEAKAASNISFTYEKTGFTKNDLKPEHYFDCTDITDANKPIQYTVSDQKIEYLVNFNQKLQINTQGKDVFSHDMGRDIDEMINVVSDVMAIEDKVKNIESMLENTQYADEESQAKLNTMLEAAKLELSYAEENMQKCFETGITKFQEHQKVVDLAIADLGARENRLTLNKNRLEDQQTSFEELKSKNEEVDVTQVAIKFKAAENVYDASLTAAAKVVQKSLLDYI